MSCPSFYFLWVSLVHNVVLGIDLQNVRKSCFTVKGHRRPGKTYREYVTTHLHCKVVKPQDRNISRLPVSHKLRYSTRELIEALIGDSASAVCDPDPDITLAQLFYAGPSAAQLPPNSHASTFHIQTNTSSTSSPPFPWEALGVPHWVRGRPDYCSHYHVSTQPQYTGPLTHGAIEMRTTLRRSCDACARAKHGCDLKTPKCSRCLRRKAQCVYANAPAAASDSSGFDGALTRIGSRDRWPRSPTASSGRTTPELSDGTALLGPVDASFDPFDSYPATRVARPQIQRLIHHCSSHSPACGIPTDTIRLQSSRASPFSTTRSI